MAISKEGSPPPSDREELMNRDTEELSKIAQASKEFLAVRSRYYTSVVVNKRPFTQSFITGIWRY